MGRRKAQTRATERERENGCGVGTRTASFARLLTRFLSLLVPMPAAKLFCSMPAIAYLLEREPMGRWCAKEAKQRRATGDGRSV